VPIAALVNRPYTEEVRYSKEPETGFWTRFMSGFIQIMPVEKQL
jgi:hypothetical protein